MCVAYAIIWMPYGVARGLFYSQKEPKTTIKCFYIITQTVAYAIFTVIPFVYIGTNRRMFRDTIQRVRQAARATFSKNRRLVVTSSKDTVDIELTSNTAETNVSFQKVSSESSEYSPVTRYSWTARIKKPE